MKTRSAFIMAVLLASCAHPPVPSQDVSPAVATARASDGTIDVTVPAVGRVGAAAGTETKLSFATSGRIAGVAVHVGDRVGAGDTLASLDTQPLVLAARQAGADAQAAAAQASAAAVDRTSTRLAVDRAAVERATRLFAAGVVARKDVEASQAQLAADRADVRTASAGLQAARATVESADARAALALRDLTNGTLRSPIDGVVTAVFHQAGESVDPTVAVVAIAPGRNSQVALQVSGTDAVRIATGDAVALHLGTGKTVSGRVTGVAGAVDPATQSAQVLVRAEVPTALAGSSVDAEITVAHDHGILIPKTAVVADPSTGKTLVFVQGKDKDGSVKFDERDVRVIFQNDRQAEVTGLRPGETVAATGAFELLPPADGGA